MEAVLRRLPRAALRKSLCEACARNLGGASVAGNQQRIGLQNSNRIRNRSYQTTARRTFPSSSPPPTPATPLRPPEEQAVPLQGYYEALLNQPLPAEDTAPSTRPPASPPEAAGGPKSEHEERIAKARVVFGSRLAGPAERRSELDAESTLVAGVWVPPRPSEPDNCCMSGCVNCVWDRFRDELEEWAMKSGEARARLAQARRKQRMEGTGLMAAEEGTPGHVAVSMDDDGGGSETNWGLDELMKGGGGGPGDLFGGIPVGIREFMRTEKRLKERHMRERTMGG
ncbi:MAG: hypothetical protein M4579_005599 [Chaenotheca gracillima]|nr:MAG: hypothetical protein M4579_005599 [Chaenotheca gracillima]